jgi:hypothetical protein
MYVLNRGYYGAKKDLLDYQAELTEATAVR